MLIGVVSDTHGHVANTRDAIRVLESFGPEAVIHCGDIGTIEVVRLFDRWPTHFVLGNVDDADELTDGIREAGQTLHGRFGTLELAGARIAFLHGDDSERLSQAIHDGWWDLVCHGHTHVAKQKRIGKTLLLNPGALYRAQPHSLAIVDLAKLDATIMPL